MRFLLKPLAQAYAAAMRRRAQGYASGDKPQWRPPVPCVSVGNISAGGSGKTPLTIWLAQWACKHDLTPLVLTRGYGGRPPYRPYPVSPDSPASEAGDEPVLLARACAGLPKDARVVADPLRIRSGPWGMEQYAPELVLLDDGFQHLAVKRDLNLVLLTPEDLNADWDRPIPLGRWREDASALARADAVLVKAGPEGFAPLRELAAKRLGQLGVPVFPFALNATELVTVADGQPASLDERPYILVTGVAKPQQAAATARAFTGEEPLEILAFGDHHRYTRADAARIVARAKAQDAVLLTTPKDAVKLAGLVPEPSAVPLLTFSLDLTFEPGLFVPDNQDFPTFFAAWAARKGLTPAP